MFGGKTDSIPESAGAFKIISILIICGLTAITFYAIQNWNLLSFTKTFSIGILSAGAALLIGGLPGSIFGISRTHQQILEYEKESNNNITG